MPLAADFCGDKVFPEGVTRALVLRHGKTHANGPPVVVDGKKKWVAQGRDANGKQNRLDETGEMQARMAGATIRRNVDVKRIVTSPLDRATQTCALAQTGCGEIIYDDGLREISFGQNENELLPEQAFTAKDYPDRESGHELAERVVNIAKKYLHQEGTLLVTSGIWIETMARLMGIELTEAQRANAVLLDFTLEGSTWHVTTYETPVVLISGATGGIGQALAEELRAYGYRVSLGARDPKRLEEAFGKETAQVHFANFYAEKDETMKAWVDGAVAKFGRIDALVNNAGYGEHVHVQEVDYAKLATQWQTNSVAPLSLTNFCLPHLKQDRRGRVVYINSMSGKRSRNDLVGYNMTKAALKAQAETLQHDTWHDGIRVVSFFPGFVKTPMSAYTEMIAPEDMIQPETMARMVREAIERPNNAATPEIDVRCMPEYP